MNEHNEERPITDFVKIPRSIHPPDPEPEPNPPSTSTIHPNTTPIAPPTQPGIIPQVRPISNWPGVVGIIALILGILSLISSLWVVFATIFFSFFKDYASTFNQQIYNSSSQIVMNISLYTVKIAVAVLLLFVGAKILQRNHNAPKLAIRYSCLQMIVALITVVLTIMMQYQLMQNSQTYYPPPWVSGQMLFVGVVVTFFSSIAFPVFLLLWFNRNKIQQETKQW